MVSEDVGDVVSLSFDEDRGLLNIETSEKCWYLYVGRSCPVDVSRPWTKTGHVLQTTVMLSRPCALVSIVESAYVERWPETIHSEYSSERSLFCRPCKFQLLKVLRASEASEF